MRNLHQHENPRPEIAEIEQGGEARCRRSWSGLRPQVVVVAQLSTAAKASSALGTDECTVNSA
jgi:hypothetical protein